MGLGLQALQHRLLGGGGHVGGGFLHDRGGFGGHVLASSQHQLDSFHLHFFRDFRESSDIFRNHFRRSRGEIGRRFGGRDHTTVLHAVRKINAERLQLTELNQQLHVLEQTLKG